MAERTASGSTGEHPHEGLVAFLLGQLGLDEERGFRAHLAGCAACARQVDELGPVTTALAAAAPPVAVPPGLEARTLGAVARAAGRGREGARRPVRRRRRGRWSVPALTVAVTAAVVVVALVVLGDDGPGGGTRIALESTRGAPVDVVADVRTTAVGREVVVEMRRLRDPRPDGLYELWFVARDDAPGRPRRVSAGTFHPDEEGRGTARLVGAAEAARYPRLSVTLEPADGDPRRQGPEVLRPTR